MAAEKRNVYSKITCKIKVGSCHAETKQLLKEVDTKIYFSGSDKFMITERRVQAQRNERQDTEVCPVEARRYKKRTPRHSET